MICLLVDIDVKIFKNILSHGKIVGFKIGRFLLGACLKKTVLLPVCFQIFACTFGIVISEEELTAPQTGPFKVTSAEIKLVEDVPHPTPAPVFLKTAFLVTGKKGAFTVIAH